MTTCTQYQILCTGGAGYIGSHCVLKLASAGLTVLVVDNDYKDSQDFVKAIENDYHGKVKFLKLDMCDQAALNLLFADYTIQAVIHLAALKSPSESIKQPLLYYENNLIASINLIRAMDQAGCKRLVYSSSASIYRPHKTAIVESDEAGPSHPYGQTKLMTEKILEDLSLSDPNWDIISLRYFNPIGADISGNIKEAPSTASNILHCILQVAGQEKDFLEIYGNDWDTPDGTGIRDYIHIEDLADGHLAALNSILHEKKYNYRVYNLGSGEKTSVLELVRCFEKVTDCKVPFHFKDRRPGDLGCVIANPSKAQNELGWKTKRSVEEGCLSAWKWYQKNNTKTRP